MKLEEVLEQKSEIEEFLNTLAEAHHTFLFDVQDAGKLDKVRKDIKICYNDLCKLNGILISVDGDGSIRKEMELLNRQKSKLIKLADKQKELRLEKEQWQMSKDEQFQKETLGDSNDTFSLRGNYHKLLNEYIDDVGIAHTSLATNETDGDPDINRGITSKSNKSDLLKRMALLDCCKKEVDLEIKQLESLLSNFRKDQEFIQREFKNQKSEFDGIILQLDEDLANIKHSQTKVLIKLGLRGPKEQNDALKLFQSRMNSNKTKLDFQEEMNHANDFIQVKLDALNDELKEFKEEMHQLEHTRNIWEEAVNKIVNLEKDLKSKLLNNPKIPPRELSVPIGNTVDQLEDLYSVASSEMLRKCLRNEIEVLERARQELNNDTFLRTEEKPKREKSPSFFLTGTSPPKIGINKETIPSLSGSFPQVGTSTGSLEKLKKKE